MIIMKFINFLLIEKWLRFTHQCNVPLRGQVGMKCTNRFHSAIGMTCLNNEIFYLSPSVGWPRAFAIPLPAHSRAIGQLPPDDVVVEAMKMICLKATSLNIDHWMPKGEEDRLLMSGNNAFSFVSRKIWKWIRLSAYKYINWMWHHPRMDNYNRGQPYQ